MPKKKKKGKKSGGEVVCKGHIGAVYGICTGLAQFPLPDVHPIIKERKDAAQSKKKVKKKKKGEKVEEPPPLQIDRDFCGQVIASAGWDTTVAIWSVDGGRCLARLEGHEDWVRAVEFVRIESADDIGGIDWTHLVTGSWDSTLKLWDLKGGHCVATMEGHTDGVRALAAGRDLVVSGAFDKTIRVWRLSCGAAGQPPNCDCEMVLSGHKDVVMTVAMLEARLVISGGWDGQVRAWDLESEGRCVWILQAHEEAIEAISLVSGSPQVFMTGSQDCTVRVWDLAEVNQVYGIEPEEEDEYADDYNNRSSMRNQDERPPSPGFDDELEWSDEDEDEDAEWNQGDNEYGQVDSDFDFDSDIELDLGQTIPEVVVPGCAQVLHAQRRDKDGHARAVYAVCCHEDFAITGSGDRSIKIWSLNTGRCHKTLVGHTSRVRSLRMATSAAGEVLVSSGDDRDVRVWPLHKINYREPPVKKEKKKASPGAKKKKKK